MIQSLMSVRVISRQDEASDVVSWRLVAEDTSLFLPRFEAGAHVDVYICDDLIRKYSLCNDPGEEGVYEIAVKRDPVSRGGSALLHANLRAGNSIKISQPLNHFSIDATAEHVVLIAAGIGVTPLLAMCHSLHRSGKIFELHYFARSPRAAAYAAQLKSCHFSSQVHFYFGLDPSATLLALQNIFLATSDTPHVYFCGPMPFMASVKLLASRCLPLSHIHYEYFSPASTKPSPNNEPFEVVLARTGITLTVPSNKSITDILFENAIEIETSCEAGVCGACVITVLDGVPHHHDEVLSAEDRAMNNKMLPCVSRCMGPRLTLDL